MFDMQQVSSKICPNLETAWARHTISSLITLEHINKIMYGIFALIETSTKGLSQI